MARCALLKLGIALYVLAAFFAAEVPVVPGTSPSTDVHGLQTRDGRAAAVYVVTSASAPAATVQRPATVTDVRQPARRLSVPTTIVLRHLPVKAPRADAASDRPSSDQA